MSIRLADYLGPSRRRPPGGFAAPATGLRWLLGVGCWLLLTAAQGADFDWPQVVQKARERAAQAYQPVSAPVPQWLLELDYRAWQDIRFDPNAALWAGQGLSFSVRFHHPGSIYRQPVAISQVEAGQATPLAYAPGQFFYGPEVDRQRVPGDLGYAGFTVYAQVGGAWQPVAEFLGGSFMRAGAPLLPGGVRSRALAIDTGLPSGEEFPVFTDFWLVRPAAGSRQLTVYALLESPRVSGAYRVRLTPGAQVVTAVDCELFFRDAVGRLGLGPLSSMFWYGENGPPVDDYRPEVHSSDGLLVHAGKERLWRPLVNPQRLGQQSLPVPPGTVYGLVQRDRDFGHYQDLDAAFEAQPSVVLEPQKGFGAGWLELLELPVRDGLNQNVLAYFVPQAKVRGGDQLSLRYRLRWGDREPGEQAGRVLATRVARQDGVSTYQIDFASLGAGGAPPRPEISVQGGKGGKPGLRPLGDGWRLTLPVEHGDGAPLTIRAGLLTDAGMRSETWLYHLGEE
jgi:glucans biosynthesis protein